MKGVKLNFFLQNWCDSPYKFHMRISWLDNQSNFCWEVGQSIPASSSHVATNVLNNCLMLLIANCISCLGQIMSGHFEQCWRILNCFDQLWTIWNHFVTFWTKLYPFKLHLNTYHQNKIFGPIYCTFTHINRLAQKQRSKSDLIADSVGLCPGGPDVGEGHLLRILPWTEHIKDLKNIKEFILAFFTL